MEDGPPIHEVPFVVTRTLPSFSSHGHHLALCVLAFWAGPEKLPWVQWSWRKGGRAHVKGEIEGNRSFAGGGTGMKIRCLCWDGATLAHYATFSFSFWFLLKYQYVLVSTHCVVSLGHSR